MDHEIKKISIDDLTVGMFVEDVFNKDDVLLLSADSLIAREEQIENLRNQRVEKLFINIRKGRDLPQKVPEAASNETLRREEEYYKELPKAREIQKVAVETTREALSAIRSGGTFSVSKIEQASEDIVKSLIRNPDALISLTHLIKGYDEYTYTHSFSVSALATSLAQSMGYNQDLLLEVSVGGMLHDIGKMRVPEHILNKPGKLTDEEFAIMKNHPQYGLDIINEKKGISEVSKTVVIQHHERYNGRGYPHGLREDAITEIGLISAVADVYDALTSRRVYREAWTPQRALATIFQGCDLDYSSKIVHLFTRHMGIYPVGSFVRLVSGEMGVVTKADKEKLLAPTVLVLFSASGKRLLMPAEYNLAEKQQRSDGSLYNVELSLDPKHYNIDVKEFIDVKTS
ncbi:MAG: HD-GYP domain-containing protein [Chitinispirillaceae bacterium]|jgi:putative nucleotidyltransferase with HDIG domain|nr:HD-GYP domain-containing protein [Chitinispirillaceae bacterium]